MREWGVKITAFLGIALFAVLWLIDPVYSTDVTTQNLTRSIVSHAIGSAIFLALLINRGDRQWQHFRVSGLAVLLPALAVVVNNLPILALLTGSARVERTELIPLFALDCLLIGVFEEFAFRGTLFLAVLQNHRSDRKQIFWTTVLSSAVFGLIHFANLLEGAGFGATLLQVGYSFLIGGMCAIVLLKTGNLLFCVFLHAVYDFCGGLLPTLGSGHWWDTPTMIFTAVLAVAVTAWMLLVLARIKPEEAGLLFMENKEEEKNNEHHSD